MTFVVVGDLVSNGLPVQLGWSNSRGFYGDPRALADIDRFIHESQLVPLTGSGPWVTPDKLDPVQATALVNAVMRHVEVADGELPAIPDFGVPPGAVA